MDLGNNFIGSVFLRSQATDSEAGAWSEPNLYTVDVTGDLDTDGDGFNSAVSRPLLATARNPNGSLQLTLPTSAGHRYRLETSPEGRSRPAKPHFGRD